MMKRFETVVFLGIFLCEIGEGRTHLLRPHVQMDIPMVCEGLIRIAVREDPIHDVVIYPESLSKRFTLHKSGHLFFDTKGLPCPVALTLMTRGNVTQDLRFHCEGSGVRSPLILEPDIGPSSVNHSPDPHWDGIMRRALSGDLKGGTFFPRGAQRVCDGTLWKAQMYWEMADTVLERYEATNETARIILLDARALREAHDGAIAFDREILEPNHTAVMVVMRHKHKETQRETPDQTYSAVYPHS